MDLQKELLLIIFIIPKVIVSTICGIIVGWERERKQKVAGLRTMVLICVGSCIFTASALCLKNDQFTTDPGRIISTIVTGIGFLGGGVIMKNGEDKIIGITTAAFIWVISAIGILCGFGYVLMPILVTFGLLLSSVVLQKIEIYLRK